MTVAAPTDSNNDKGSCAVVKSINAPDEMRPNVPELKGGVEGAVKIELPELPDKKDLSMTSACCCCLCSLYTLWPECCGLEMNGQVCCCNIKDACLCLRFKQNGYSTCCRHTQMMHCCDSLGAEFSICHCVSSVIAFPLTTYMKNPISLVSLLFKPIFTCIRRYGHSSCRYCYSFVQISRATARLAVTNSRAFRWEFTFYVSTSESLFHAEQKRFPRLLLAAAVSATTRRKSQGSTSLAS